MIVLTPLDGRLAGCDCLVGVITARPLLPGRWPNCGKEALQGSWGAVVDIIFGESVFFVAAFAFGEFGMGDSPQLRPAG